MVILHSSASQDCSYGNRVVLDLKLLCGGTYAHETKKAKVSDMPLLCKQASNIVEAADKKNPRKRYSKSSTTHTVDRSSDPSPVFACAATPNLERPRSRSDGIVCCNN